VELTENGKSVGYLLLYVATYQKGTRKEAARLYYGSIELDGETVRIRRLGEAVRLGD
jgi:hypothetical protein